MSKKSFDFSFGGSSNNQKAKENWRERELNEVVQEFCQEESSTPIRIITITGEQKGIGKLYFAKQLATQLSKRLNQENQFDCYKASPELSTRVCGQNSASNVKRSLVEQENPDINLSATENAFLLDSLFYACFPSNIAIVPSSENQHLESIARTLFLYLQQDKNPRITRETPAIIISVCRKSTEHISANFEDSYLCRYLWHELQPLSIQETRTIFKSRMNSSNINEQGDTELETLINSSHRIPLNISILSSSIQTKPDSMPQLINYLTENQSQEKTSETFNLCYHSIRAVLSLLSSEAKRLLYTMALLPNYLTPEALSAVTGISSWKILKPLREASACSLLSQSQRTYRYYLPNAIKSSLLLDLDQYFNQEEEKEENEKNEITKDLNFDFDIIKNIDRKEIVQNLAQFLINEFHPLNEMYGSEFNESSEAESEFIREKDVIIGLLSYSDVLPSELFTDVILSCHTLMRYLLSPSESSQQLFETCISVFDELMSHNSEENYQDDYFTVFCDWVRISLDLHDSSATMHAEMLQSFFNEEMSAPAQERHRARYQYIQAVKILFLNEMSEDQDTLDSSTQQYHYKPSIDEAIEYLEDALDEIEKHESSHYYSGLEQGEVLLKLGEAFSVRRNIEDLEKTYRCFEMAYQQLKDSNGEHHVSTVIALHRLISLASELSPELANQLKSTYVSSTKRVFGPSSSLHLLSLLLYLSISFETEKKDENSLNNNNNNNNIDNNILDSSLKDIWKPLLYHIQFMDHQSKYMANFAFLTSVMLWSFQAEGRFHFEPSPMENMNNSNLTFLQACRKLCQIVLDKAGMRTSSILAKEYISLKMMEIILELYSNHFEQAQNLSSELILKIKMRQHLYASETTVKLFRALASEFYEFKCYEETIQVCTAALEIGESFQVEILVSGLMDLKNLAKEQLEGIASPSSVNVEPSLASSSSPSSYQSLDKSNMTNKPTPNYQNSNYEDEDEGEKNITQDKNEFNQKDKTGSWKYIALSAGIIGITAIGVYYYKRNS